MIDLLIASQEAEIDRLRALNSQLAERLYLAAECLAAAAKRNNLAEFGDRVEAFLAHAQRGDSSAPWVVVKSKDVQSAVISPGVASVCHDLNDDDADFVALARNAADVMMRRGVDWLFLERDSDGRIMADCPDHGWIPGRWDDPFSPWVDADKFISAQEKSNA